MLPAPRSLLRLACLLLLLVAAQARAGQPGPFLPVTTDAFTLQYNELAHGLGVAPLPRAPALASNDETQVRIQYTPTPDISVELKADSARPGRLKELSFQGTARDKRTAQYITVSALVFFGALTPGTGAEQRRRMLRDLGLAPLTLTPTDRNTVRHNGMAITCGLDEDGRLWLHAVPLPPEDAR